MNLIVNWQDGGCIINLGIRRIAPGELLPGELPPGELPPGELPPENCPRRIATRWIAPEVIPSFITFTSSFC